MVENDALTRGWISLEAEASVHLLNGKHYEPLTLEELLKEYEYVFTGLGCLPGEYHIEVNPAIKPVLHALRRVPVPLNAVQKPGKLRVCIDPRDLNGIKILVKDISSPS